MGLSAFLDALEVRAHQGIVEWCESNIHLTSDFVADPGPFRIEITPYMQEIYKELDFGSSTEEITVLFGSQLGKTQMILNFSLYCLTIRPGPMLSVLPTTEMCQAYSKQRLGPMLESCDAAYTQLRPSIGRSATSTLLSKLFYGGVLFLTGARSRTKLSSIPIQYLLLDEKGKVF